MNITKKQLDKFKTHALKQYPNEAAAIVVKSGDRLKVINCKNIHPDPENHFEIAADVVAPYQADGTLQGILHSHITGQRSQIDPRTPSGNDLQGHIDTCVPWGIVATDGDTVSDPIWLDDSVIAPLEGREFIHGIHDCYAIWRDYYRTVLDINMKNYARDYCWWLNNFNLYSKEAIEAEGFIEVKVSDMQAHDVLIMRVVSPVDNHCAIVTGQNKMIHQLSHRLSGEDQISRWSKYIMHCYRHKSLL